MHGSNTDVENRILFRIYCRSLAILTTLGTFWSKIHTNQDPDPEQSVPFYRSILTHNGFQLCVLAADTTNELSLIIT
jgi:hypothetical protein